MESTISLIAMVALQRGHIIVAKLIHSLYGIFLSQREDISKSSSLSVNIVLHVLAATAGYLDIMRRWTDVSIAWSTWSHRCYSLDSPTN